MINGIMRGKGIVANCLVASHPLVVVMSSKCIHPHLKSSVTNSGSGSSRGLVMLYLTL